MHYNHVWNATVDSNDKFPRIVWSNWDLKLIKASSERMQNAAIFYNRNADHFLKIEGKLD